MDPRDGAARRWLLPLLVALLLASAGCLSGVPSDSPAANESDDAAPTDDLQDEPSNESTSPSSLPPVNTTAAELVGNSAVESPLDPKPLPERPDEFTQNATEEYVEAYERAYLWNTKLTNDTTDIEISTDPATVHTDEQLTIVTVDVGYSPRTEDSVGSFANYHVSYSVNETELRRSHDYRLGPPRIENATVLERWTENDGAAS